MVRAHKILRGRRVKIAPPGKISREGMRQIPLSKICQGQAWALQRGQRRMIVFDDGPSMVLLREASDLLHVQWAMTNFGHRTIGSHMLEMKERDPLSPNLQQSQSSTTRRGHP